MLLQTSLKKIQQKTMSSAKWNLHPPSFILSIAPIWLGLIFLFWQQAARAETQQFLAVPRIYDVTTNAASYVNGAVPTYARFEITFQLESNATNLYLPYDESPPPGVEAKLGVSVDAQFSPDNWQTVYTVPAFYYQTFEQQVQENQDWLYPTANYAWKVRFAPNQVGNWQYRLSAIDRGGSAQVVAGNFTVIPSSSHGFVRASQQDSRYFEYDDGTYFPALGYNLTAGAPEWLNPIQVNQPVFQKMHDNGLQLARFWLSQWSIYASAWNPWTGAQQNYPSNVPATSMHGSWDTPNSQSEWVIQLRSPANEYFDSCMFINPQVSKPAVKPNTTYQLRVRYYGESIAAVCNGTADCGFALSVGGWRWGTQCQAGSGQVLSPIVQDTNASIDGGWLTLTRTWYSGANYFLPDLQMRLENIPANASTTPLAFVSNVALQEDLGNGILGPNVLDKGSMDYHLYMGQRNAYAFDKMVELAEQNGVYLRPVILEKGERFLQSYNEQGQLGGENIDYFYGDFRNLTKTRWLQQAWWRYLQARWGYSTAIHSWELMNEADPNSGRVHTLVDEFGKYMHCRVFGVAVSAGDQQACAYDHPNAHMTTTSFWHSYPRDSFWANPAYPNVDYVNIHQYIPKNPTNTGGCGGYCLADPNFYDSALATYARSLEYGAQQPTGANKPVLRGETGFTEQNYTPLSAEIRQDTQGIWLHNFIWGGINSAGLMEAYWGTSYHIAHDNVDLHPIYKRYANFIQNVPLSNGLYRDAAAQITPADAPLRAWGQKDSGNGPAAHVHLWIANANHTWKRVIDNTVTPVSGTVTIPGLQPNSMYQLERWDTYQGKPVASEFVKSTAQGEISIVVTNLIDDFAIKLAIQSDPNVTATPTATATPVTLPTFTSTPTFTPSSTATATLTTLPTLTATPTFTPELTATATPTSSSTATLIATATTASTTVSTPTATNTPNQTATPEATSTVSPITKLYLPLVMR